MRRNLIYLLLFTRLGLFFPTTIEAARQEAAIDAPSSADRAEFLEDLDDLRVCGSLLNDRRSGKHLGQSTRCACTSVCFPEPKSFSSPRSPPLSQSRRPPDGLPGTEVSHSPRSALCGATTVYNSNVARRIQASSRPGGASALLRAMRNRAFVPLVVFFFSLRLPAPWRNQLALDQSQPHLPNLRCCSTGSLPIKKRTKRPSRSMNAWNGSRRGRIPTIEILCR